MHYLWLDELPERELFELPDPERELLVLPERALPDDPEREPFVVDDDLLLALPDLPLALPELPPERLELL